MNSIRFPFKDISRGDVFELATSFDYLRLSDHRLKLRRYEKDLIFEYRVSQDSNTKSRLKQLRIKCKNNLKTVNETMDFIENEFFTSDTTLSKPILN